MSLPIRNFGPYRIIREVGIGGLGRVFEGIDSRTGQTVAIKVLHDKYTNNRKFLGIFHKELLIMSRLHHKHIVTYIDGHFEPPNCYIVTEFIHGWSLHSLIKKIKRMPPLVALCILIDMLQGLDHLHLHDHIHADLSAPNVLIEKSGRVLITDFGLTCELDVEDYKNYMVGTPGYYSPEHITDSSIVPQTDIFCAGLILFEMITGRKAVPAVQDRRKLLYYMKHIPFDMVSCGDKRLTIQVRKLLKAALAFNYNRRIVSADVMMFECYKILRVYGIRFARHGIKKFLIDQGLTQGPYNGAPQNIYIGSAS